jgi:hypothetical protein
VFIQQNQEHISRKMNIFRDYDRAIDSINVVAISLLLLH